MKNKIIKMIAMFVVSVFVGLSNVASTFADGVVTISPLSQGLILNPGETYNGSFKVTNQANNGDDLKYVVTVEPFFVNEKYEIYYGDSSDYNKIVDWITVYNTSGVLSPNKSTEIRFTINVPDDAPAGGQYAAIKATSVNDDIVSTDSMSTAVKVQYGVAYTIYADIAGDTRREGKILDISVPGFMLDGNVSGSATIENTGNVHGIANYTLKIFPLFSNEEVYTNEENPERMNVMPERAFYNETVWENTPPIGIFNVVYTVEFEGVTAQVKKLVIKCPIWLLFIIIFAIIALIMYFFVRSKNRKNNKKRTQSAKAE